MEFEYAEIFVGQRVLNLFCLAEARLFLRPTASRAQKRISRSESSC